MTTHRQRHVSNVRTVPGRGHWVATRVGIASLLVWALACGSTDGTAGTDIDPTTADAGTATDGAGPNDAVVDVSDAADGSSPRREPDGGHPVIDPFANRDDGIPGWIGGASKLDAGSLPDSLAVGDADVTDADGDTAGSDTAGSDTAGSDTGIADPSDGDVGSGDDGQAQDAGDSSVSDAHDANNADTAPASSTNCLAKPGATVPALPLPGPDQCTWKAPNFFLGPPPPETLKVTVGVASDGPTPWTPLKDQDFLAMKHGMQGSFHSFAAFRVGLAGINGDYAKLQAEAWLSASCGVIALGKQPIVFAKAVPGLPGQWGNAEGNDQGMVLYFGIPGNQSVKFCNTWARLHVRVRQHGTQSWGSANVLVRLYDSK